MNIGTNRLITMEFMMFLLNIHQPEMFCGKKDGSVNEDMDTSYFDKQKIFLYNRLL